MFTFEFVYFFSIKVPDSMISEILKNILRNILYISVTDPKRTGIPDFIFPLVVTFTNS